MSVKSNDSSRREEKCCEDGMAGLSENEALDAIDDEEREIAARETYAEEKHEPSKGVQDLVRKVSESITEITEQHRKPRKRARRPESVDWTGEDGKDERQVAEVAQDMDIVEDELMHNLNISSVEDIMNTVVVLAKAAVKRDGEKHNAKVLQATLEEMHFQYTSLANECTCLQDRLRKEKDSCSTLEKDVERVQNHISQLQSENNELKGQMKSLERQTRCQICYEAKRNCLLMPCLHFMFCTQCVDMHFQTNEARLCPICRKGVSGVLVMQLDQS